MEDYIGEYYKVIKQDARSLDNGSYGVCGDLIIIYP